MSDHVAEIRRQLVRLVVGVVVLDAIAIALLRLTPLGGLQGVQRGAFMAVWLMLTLAIVLPALQSIRRSRLRARHARANAARAGR